MIRSHLAQHGHEPGFRWRGTEVSRLEGFVDAVFGFAVTLLVASLEVPRTYAQLLATMQGFVAFAVCFAVLFHLWYQHYRFFRRYGLQDVTTHVLSAVLVFVVLFYVYPLKFLFEMISRGVLGLGATAGGDYAILPAQTSTLMVIYGIGYTAVFAVFTLLYLHAYRQREALGLTELEALRTKASIGANLATGCVGPCSIALVLLMPPRYSGLAGMAYFLVAVTSTVNGFWFGRQVRALERAQ